MDIRERLSQRWRNRHLEINANLVQSKPARNRASQDMKIVILDAYRVNPFRKPEGSVRGVAPINASHEVSTAVAAAPINDCKGPAHFQAYSLNYPPGSLTRPPRYRLMVLPVHHPAPHPPVAQTANPLP